MTVSQQAFLVTHQMDWAEIRKAKFRCKKECACFNPNMGGCSLGLLPRLKCEEFKRIIRKRGSSSVVERRFAKKTNPPRLPYE